MNLCCGFSFLFFSLILIFWGGWNSLVGNLKKNGLIPFLILA